MASLQELNAYKGDAALGGGTQGNETLLGTPDLKQTMGATERFSAMQFQMNRDLWVQRNLEIQRTSEEAAKQLAVEYGDLIPEDQSVIDGAVKEFTDFYYNNPNAVRFQIDPKTGTDNGEQYKEFLKHKQKLDHLIVRGNKRAAQLKLAQDEMSKMTDSKKFRQYNAHIQAERQKGIEENIVTMPPIAGFDHAKYFSAAATSATNNYGFVQLLGNDNLTTDITATNLVRGSATVMQDYLSGTEETGELREFIDGSVKTTNALINDIKSRAPKKADGTIDQAALQSFMQSDPNGRMLIELQDRTNDFLTNMNNRYKVESGRQTEKRLREYMGINEDLKPMNILDGVTQEDMIRMFLVDKAKVDVDTTVQHTGQALGYEELAFRKKQDARDWEKKLQDEQALGSEKNIMYSSLMDAANNGIGKKVYIQTPVKKADGTTVYNAKEFAVEVEVTEALVNALALQENKKTTKTTEGALTAGTGEESEQTVTETMVRPRRIYVIPSADRDPNKSKIHVSYENGDFKDYSGTELYGSLNFIYGRDAKVSAAVSESSEKWRISHGILQPDARRIGEYLGKNQQGTPHQFTGKRRTSVKNKQGEYVFTQPAPAQPKKKKTINDIYNYGRK